MTESKYIAGAGGGGGKNQKSPTEADDTLDSKQYVEVLDVISEGEIEGLEDSKKSIFFDGVPLKAADGTNNFQDVTVVTRSGTQGQTFIPKNVRNKNNAKSRLFNNVENVVPVNSDLLKNTPVVKRITDQNVNRARIAINIPSLQKIEKDGDIKGISVTIKIEISYDSGSYSLVDEKTISGKSSGGISRDYNIKINSGWSNHVDIRVTRLTDDSTTKKIRDTTWTSLTEIISTKFSYPNTALVGLRLGSDQFNAVPTRKYLIRGIKVGVPTNAKIDTSETERLVVATGATESITKGRPGRITYDGVWDGELSSDIGAPGGLVWTNDPAWCLWDLLTNERYGAGIPESSLDRYDFFSVSQYCNELVPDGRGGREVRFSCNLLINQRKEVYTVIQEMTSIFRGISYYGAGSLALMQDRPSDAQYTLGPSNVIEGVFSYAGSSVRSRHTCATVAYQTYEEQGEVAFEYVEDADAVAKYGINNKEIKAVGCYSQGQAHRIGKWALLSEQNLYETCSFGLSIDSGIVVRPGMVVDIADPLRGGTRRNGRVSSATVSQVTIDSTTDLSVNMSNSPTISVVLPNGLVETRNISTISGTAVNVSTDFSQAPAVNAPWLIQTSDIESQQFRVVSVAESGDGTFGVTALKYNETIYNAVDRDRELTDRDITNLTEKPEAPTGVVAEEFLYEEGGMVRTGVDLGWVSPGLGVQDFTITYRLDEDNFEKIVTENNAAQLRGLKSGTLEVQIAARSPIGKSGPPVIATFSLQGKTAIPGDVQNLTIEPLLYNSARLKWDETVDLDVKVSGKVHIRHNNISDGSATWSNSTDLIAAIAGNATDAVVPLLAGEYLVKFEDDGGRKSETEASIIVGQPIPQMFHVAATQREDQLATPFSGTKTNTTYESNYDSLILTTSNGDIDSSGEYAFSGTLDLEDVYSVDLERRLVSRGIYPNDTIDDKLEDIDTWDSFDGDVVDQVNAELYVRKTDDDPSGTPTYDSWQPLASGVFKGRAFQFKAVLTSNDVSQNILIDELGYEAKFQQRTEQSTATISSGSAAKAVPFANPFFTGTTALGGANSVLPTIGITPLNMASGDYFQLSSISRTGFTITFKNSSDTIVDRDFNYMATGFGKAE